MSVTGTFDYGKAGGTQVLRLPYAGGQLSMPLALPPEGAGLPAEAALEAWRAALSPQEAAVSIPKFAMDLEYDLIPTLGQLGVREVFESKADLLGAFDASTHVDKAIQKTFVEVNEEGTEAAAATAISLFSVEEQSRPAFVADRPFALAIQDDETGLALFMGMVADPAG